MVSNFIEKDFNCKIRLEAFRHTNNWKEAENDRDWEIRREAFRNTKNWQKAQADDVHDIREEAIQALKLEYENLKKS